MQLSEDYKNIVKLRFNAPNQLEDKFYATFYLGIINPERFNPDIFARFSLQEILDYLKKSHTEYLTVWFPKIEKLINDIQAELGVSDVTLTLKSFIVNYYNELTNHINFEEKVLYNFVDKLLKGIYVEKEKIFVLNHFLETHNHNVTDELVIIQKIVLNKDAKIGENSRVKELFEILNIIQNDLVLHGVIEDELLIGKIHQYIESEF